jgi:hypothetical protein
MLCKIQVSINYSPHYIKDRVYAKKVNNITELKHRIEETLASITQDVLLNVWNEIIYRLDVLRATNGAHVEVYWILVYWSIDWNVVVYLIKTKMSWVVLLITAKRFKIAPKITNLLRLIMGWIIYGHSVLCSIWNFFIINSDLLKEKYLMLRLYL